MEHTEKVIAVQDVVQCIDENDPFFGCLFIVDELKPAWKGFTGYYKHGNQGVVHIRMEVSKVAHVGPSVLSIV